MNRVGLVMDMSHSAERSTLEAIEISERPIVISHANPSFFHPALRILLSPTCDSSRSLRLALLRLWLTTRNSMRSWLTLRCCVVPALKLKPYSKPCTMSRPLTP